jgi:hypothetical protein
MRTTLTIDEDVAERIEIELRKRGGRFKDLVNELLRLGLNVTRELESTQLFKVNPVSMGAYQDLPYDNIGELIERFEGARHK